MDELIKEMARGSAIGTGFELWQAVVALTLSFFLTLVIALFYRLTHRGLSYSVAFVHAMIIMGVTVAIIMLIIGSNIARAFSLVGALSIIRFRNAVKDSRDVAFIFLTMAVGMATGTGFYLTAIVFTVFMCAVIYILHRFNVGAEVSREVLVKIHLPAAADYHQIFNELFWKYLKDSSLLGVETLGEGKLNEVVYSVEFKTGVKESEFIEAIRALNGGNRVVLLAGQENINV